MSLPVTRIQTYDSSLVFLSCGLQTSTCMMSGLGNCKMNILTSCAKPNIHPFPCVPFELPLSVWKQTFPLNVMLCWARFSLNPSGAPDGKVQVHVWKQWPHLLLNLNFISCNCLLFHGLLRCQPIANAESCKNNKTIEARKITGSLIKFWLLKLV